MHRLLALVVLGLAPVTALAADAPNRGGWSLFGPLLAIALALTTRQVVPSLAVGALVSSIVARDFDIMGGVLELGSHMRSAVLGDDFLPTFQQQGAVAALASWLHHDNTRIMLFSLMVAAMVGVIYRAGATRDLVRKVEGLARGRRGAMVSSWLSGAIVFFDDYANCLVVGGAMGPLYDRHKVSRAKLAYIVDSTAAPVASLAVVSTWVGFEVGLIADGIEGTNVALTAFAIFLAALPFRFYSIYTLGFVGSIAGTGRDFGPMLDAETEALARPDVDVHAESEGSGQWWAAALSVVALVAVTAFSLYTQGVSALGDKAASARLFEIVGEADAYRAMLLGSGTGLGLSVVLSMASRGLSPSQVPSAIWSGIRPVFDALAILYLAWTLGGAVKATGAAPYLATIIDGSLPIAALPTVAFLLAAGTAFATGTSFGTMSILLPTVVQIAVQADPEMGPVALGAIAAVLAGSCLGDHASPISDTTVLSALGAQVDVITHVRTQLPYALTTGAISIGLGYLPAGMGISPYLCLPLGLAACFAIVRLVGREPELPIHKAQPEAL
ncbi:MAG: Na+/H+ antiporter NhaC family protein [Deltaproteobacteria bacterium]|nr:MAG: Na+/H+ antiporter NhaC family protein [Deltaproteobacteria bacterium]